MTPPEPRGGEGLTVEQAMKLLPGDQLEVIAADSFLTARGFGNGAKVTFRGFDGEFIDLADMPCAQGSSLHRFAFVSRPSSPPSGGGGWPSREEGHICTVSYAMRPDGGLRIWSDDMPGLILSHSNPEKAAACVWPAIKVLRNYALPAAPLTDGVGE